MLVVFFAVGMVFMLSGVAVGILTAIADLAHGRRLLVHLVFTGGVSMLILGAAQFFAGAFLATGPPPRRTVRGQLALWIVGALIVALSVFLDAGIPAVVGAIVLLAALVLFARGLLGLKRRSLQRAPWAVRWYLTAAAFIAIGISVGALLALDVRWPRGDPLSAHVVFNIAGWIGTAIVGTLHTFYPSMTGTRLRFPRLERIVWAFWTAGVVLTAVGYGTAVGEMRSVGWAILLAGAGMLVANIVASARRGRPLGLAAQVVGVAQIALIAGVSLCLVASVATSGGGLTGDYRPAVAVLLLAGWVGFTVLGSLVHLLSVMRRVRSMPRPVREMRHRFDPTLAPIGLASVLVLSAGLLWGVEPLSWVAGSGLAAVYAILGIRAVAEVSGAVRAAPVEI